MPILVGALATSWVAIGCATPNQVVYSAVNQPPRPFQRRTADVVEVFIGRPPNRPHLEVGVFEVYQGQKDDGAGRSTEEMIQTLRVHSALRGCDAVQILNIELAGRYAYRVVRGVCEIYTDDQAVHAAAAVPAPALPGEGHPCSLDPESVIVSCADPLVCEKKRCVSPYH